MSKNFLTREQAYSKLSAGTASNPDHFITKAEAIDAGADTDLLLNYPSTGFPVDDDIVSGSAVVDILRTSTLPGRWGAVLSDNRYFSGYWYAGGEEAVEPSEVVVKTYRGLSENYWAFAGVEQALSLAEYDGKITGDEHIFGTEYGFAVKFFAGGRANIATLMHNIDSSEPQQVFFVDNGNPAYIASNGTGGRTDLMDSASGHYYLLIYLDTEGIFRATAFNRESYGKLLSLDEILESPYLYFDNIIDSNSYDVGLAYFDVGGLESPEYVDLLPEYFGTQNTYIGDIEMFKLSAILP